MISILISISLLLIIIIHKIVKAVQLFGVVAGRLRHADLDDVRLARAHELQIGVLGLSLSQWTFTGNVQWTFNIVQWMSTFVISGVWYFAPTYMESALGMDIRGRARKARIEKFELEKLEWRNSSSTMASNRVVPPSELWVLARHGVLQQWLPLPAEAAGHTRPVIIIIIIIIICIIIIIIIMYVMHLHIYIYIYIYTHMYYIYIYIIIHTYTYTYII